MNKSLEYIKRRIKEGNCENMSPEEFVDMKALPMSSFWKMATEGKTIILATTKNENEVVADLIYNPDADFNYFATESCVCDGSLLFMIDLIDRLLNRVQSLNTYYIPAFEDIPEEELCNYKLHYETGDIVTNSYIIEPPYKDKPWMRNSFTVMLPIKFTIEKRK